MRLLCVIDSLGPGGAQRQLVELARGFSEHGLDVSFLVYHRIDFYKNDLDHLGIPVTYVLDQSYLRRVIRIRKYIRKGRFDVVLSFLAASSFICEISSFPSRNWKLIVGERSANPNLFGSIRLRAYRWFHLFADFVVANSAANIDIVRRINPLIPEDRLKVIYNIVDPSLFKDISPNLHTDTEFLNIIVGASHRRLKNLKGMVLAVASLTPQYRKRIKIKWYGDSIDEPYLDSSYLEAIELIESHRLWSNIEFFPASRDFLKFAADADVIALFSEFEGLPNVICEAMALGKPVMCSDVSDMRIILKHNLNQIFDPKSQSSIRACFEYFLDLDFPSLRAIGCENRRVAQCLFNKEIIISAYLELIYK